MAKKQETKKDEPLKIDAPAVDTNTGVAPEATTKPEYTATINKEAGEMGNKKPDMVEVSKQDWDDVQQKLKMLYEVADKGRIFNYENQKQESQNLKVQLSVYNNNIVIGWRTVLDELVKHPTTGATVGEKQEYELTLLGKDEAGKYTQRSFLKVEGYSSFSNLRYSQRIESQVVAKKQDMQGNWSFDLLLPDNSVITLDGRFVN